MTGPEAAASHGLFAMRIAALDTSLFSAVLTESTARDQRSMLACQRVVREAVGAYSYLEIGSHLGGSLQPYVLDPHCRAMYSIDPRPKDQPDARGVRFAYAANSTQRMLQNLERLDPRVRTRLVCFERRSRDVDPADIRVAPHLCFIDGEHTDDAVREDFEFCRRVLAAGGLILFHDAGIIYNSLAAIISSLDREGVRYDAAHLPDTLFAIELGNGGLLSANAMARVKAEQFRGYLFTLQGNDSYRRAFIRWSPPWLRTMWARIRRPID